MAPAAIIDQKPQEKGSVHNNNLYVVQNPKQYTGNQYIMSIFKNNDRLV